MVSSPLVPNYLFYPISICRQILPARDMVVPAKGASSAFPSMGYLDAARRADYRLFRVALEGEEIDLVMIEEEYKLGAE